MNLKEEILRLIGDSQAELNRNRAYGYLVEALKLSETYLLENHIDGAYEKAHILRELAYEEIKTEKRNKRWQESLQTLEKAIKLNLSYQLIETYSYFVVDSLQDEFGNRTSAQQTKDLRNALSFIEQCLKITDSPTEKSILFSRKASIIKHLSFKELTKDLKRKQLEKSIRCAELAVNTYATGSSVLELALCEWAIANLENTDELFSNRLKLAETHLKNELLKDNENALLTLSRFYRLNFLPKNCCDIFPKSVEDFKNIRKLLRSVHLYAESAISLWYANFPKEISEMHLQSSKALLETSISAGYGNARNIVNLAFIQSILGQYEDGLVTLNEINLEGTGLDWNGIIEKIHTPVVTESLFNGFALGIENCGVWTRLGTYAKTFLKDINLSELMYRAAIRIDPTNPIALTNLARLLINEFDDNDSLVEAKRLIQKAKNFADRRFCWWRQVLSQIEEIENNTVISPSIPIVEYLPIGEQILTNQKEIRKKYFEIKNLDSPQLRGFELEKLFYELAKMTFPVAEYSYHFNRLIAGTYQIDGYFKLDSDRYRVECKWHTNENANSNEVIIFANKLKTSGISGVMVSMTEFASTAIGEARELAKEKPILLVNGKEMEEVFLGKMNLDQLIQIKRSHFDQYSNPYFKVFDYTTDK
jgi:tetratricopeptide (TPR) repeat protein